MADRDQCIGNPSILTYGKGSICPSTWKGIQKIQKYAFMMLHRGEGNHSILNGAPSKEMRPNELHKYVANMKSMEAH